MNFSKYNIFSRIRDSENYFILNGLTKNADILDPAKAREIMDREYTDIEEYVEKGYLANEEEEKRLYRSAYLDFIDNRDNSEIQIFFVPHFECNFNCSYCYQDEYTQEKQADFEPVLKAFFEYIDKEFAGRDKYITVFGGEPLLPGNSAKEKIERIVAAAGSRNIDMAIVTNGYHLLDYMDIFTGAAIREIQVTLDGTRDIHNLRRSHKNGSGSFNQIVAGIDAALEQNLPVNLRVVVDKENIHTLPHLAAFAIEKGWTAHPLFKTQLGRNYELHHCQENSSRLFERAELYETIYELGKSNPEILEFHRPAYSISRLLFDNGNMPEPLFDACPGCKTEWAFDYTGKIYSCTATVGKEGEALGTFYPAITLQEDIIDQWEERDVTAIPECRDCSVQLLCGGGCGAVAKNRCGTLHAPDCRPIKPLLEMGLSHYFNKKEA
ncbi:MAG: radical SAM protein [bacterium]|nr:radical SAM protein [bacterium]